MKLQLDAVDRSRDEMGELASKVFELSQTLRERWFSADCDEKRRVLEWTQALIFPRFEVRFSVSSFKKNYPYILNKSSFLCVRNLGESISIAQPGWLDHFNAKYALYPSFPRKRGWR